MRIIKLSAAIFTIGLFLAACNTDQTQQTAQVDPYANNGALTEDQEDYWAKENFDLQRVGNLLERSDSPQEFEEYLNEEDGINNLDLNGDGYVDYISVDEFEDRGDYERGLSLYSRFGPDLIQEIATIVFYRDDFNYPGARILLIGNEHIYGDNFYYETNWLDRTLSLVSFLFSPRDVYYHSPYYYDYYPPDYLVYEVVQTPVYITRIERLYPEPVFVYTTSPTFISKVKIKSPHDGKWMDKVHAKLAKPTKEQTEFIKSNPRRTQVAKADKPGKPDDRGADRPGRSDAAPGRSDAAPGRENQPKEDRKAEPERAKPSQPAKAEKPKVNPPKPAKVEKPNVSPPKPAQAEKPSAKPSKPARVESPSVNPPSPPKPANPSQGKGKKP